MEDKIQNGEAKDSRTQNGVTKVFKNSKWLIKSSFKYKMEE